MNEKFMERQLKFFVVLCAYKIFASIFLRRNLSIDNDCNSVFLMIRCRPVSYTHLGDERDSRSCHCIDLLDYSCSDQWDECVDRVDRKLYAWILKFHYSKPFGIPGGRIVR